MKGYAILTDSDWRSFLAPQPRIDEVNFWESGGGIAFADCLRDIHRLFDSSYVTVTKKHRFEVSRRIREEFENGRDYYRFHGNIVRRPPQSISKPDERFL